GSTATGSGVGDSPERLKYSASTMPSATRAGTAQYTHLLESSFTRGPPRWAPIRGRRRRERAACPGHQCSGLLELQQKVVRLADGQILLAVLIAQRQGGRQGPHALGVILGVLRIGQDLRA